MDSAVPTHTVTRQRNGLPTVVLHQDKIPNGTRIAILGGTMEYILMSTEILPTPGEAVCLRGRTGEKQFNGARAEIVLVDEIRRR